MCGPFNYSDASSMRLLLDSFSSLRSDLKLFKELFGFLANFTLRITSPAPKEHPLLLHSEKKQFLWNDGIICQCLQWVTSGCQVSAVCDEERCSEKTSVSKVKL